MNFNIGAEGRNLTANGKLGVQALQDREEGSGAIGERRRQARDDGFADRQANTTYLDERTTWLSSAAAIAPVHGTVIQPRCLILAILTELPHLAPSRWRCGL